jgi:mono/diheme cytochrome c family protein/uncharacterized cupredoxin-like copper-binding protein
MNTGKQINAMVAVLFLVLIAIGAYTIWDPFRSADAADQQVEKSADFGAQTFERNCRLCHGDRGQGGSAGGRLAAALPLNTDTLQGIDNGVFDPANKALAFKRVTNTIMCGRVGTQMPTWGASQGGTLNDEQIKQLAVLITEGRWDLVEEHVNTTDAHMTNDARVNVDGGTFAVDASDLVVTNAGAFTLGQYIRIGDERLRVLPKEIEVERGVDGTAAAGHATGTQVLVDGAPVIRNPAPTLRDGAVVPLGGTAESLAEAATKDDTALVVGDTTGFAPGDVLQLGDEHVRVTEVTRGIPTTGVVLVDAIGREPKKLFVSSAGDIEVGGLIRLESEPMQVKGIGEAGTGVKLDDDLSASSGVVSVDDARYLRKEYQFRLGDEWLEVVGAVDTGQTVGEAIGRAQKTLLVSGTEGIEKGMIIRIDGELLRVSDIVKPARVQLTRGDDGTAIVAHDVGTPLTKAIEQKEGQPAPDTSTGQALLEPLSAGVDGYFMTITGTAKLNVGDKYKLGDETVTIKAVDPALVRIERGVQKTGVEEHARRAPIFDGNHLAVTRGINNTAAADHKSGSQIILTQLKVKRAVGVKPAEHAKNTELFISNHLTVARAQKNTQASDHKNGDLVRNFPTAPDGPAITGQGGINVCGQNGPSETTAPSEPTPTTVAGAETVNVALAEFSVTPDQPGITAGAISFNVSNTGSTVHNFRIIKTALAADQLPVASNRVDQTQVDIVASSSGDIKAGASQIVQATLEAGNYVLICNVAGHYKLKMYAAFEVSAP